MEAGAFSSFQEDTMSTIVTNLASRLSLLHLRYAVAYSLITPTPDDDQYLMIAETFHAGLRASNPDVVARVRALVDPMELTDDRANGFWSTNLGRLLFAAGGFTESSMSRTMAAGVLDCSRQWIHELVVKGDLQAAPSLSGTDKYVFAERVRTLLIKRLDTLVK
jgi:hypothetical protein